MQKLNLETVPSHLLADARAITKKDGTLLKAKPNRRSTKGSQKYMWRMVVFETEAKVPYSCMPVCAEFDLTEDDYEEFFGVRPSRDRYGRDGWSRELAKRLNQVVDQLLEHASARKGLERWAKAFGYTN